MKYTALIFCLWNLALFAQPEGEIEAPLQQQNVNTWLNAVAANLPCRAVVWSKPRG